MSEYLEALFEGVEEGLYWYDRVMKLSKKVDQMNPQVNKKTVIADTININTPPDTPGDIPPLDKRSRSSPESVIDMELDSTGSYRVVQKKLIDKK